MGAMWIRRAVNALSFERLRKIYGTCVIIIFSTDNIHEETVQIQTKGTDEH